MGVLRDEKTGIGGALAPGYEVDTSVRKLNKFGKLPPTPLVKLRGLLIESRTSPSPLLPGPGVLWTRRQPEKGVDSGTPRSPMRVALFWYDEEDGRSLLRILLTVADEKLFVAYNAIKDVEIVVLVFGSSSILKTVVIESPTIKRLLAASCALSETWDRALSETWDRERY